MHAYIIIGSSISSRRPAAETLIRQYAAHAADIVELTTTERSIGVEDVRRFTELLRLSPVAGATRLGHIPAADMLTPEAQNALLKTLEEPPPRAVIMLGTATTAVLLPTVLSRCQILRAEGESAPAAAAGPDIIDLMSRSRGERLAALETAAQSRDDAMAWVAAAGASIHHSLLAAYGLVPAGTSARVPPAVLADLGKRLMKAQEQLQANVTPKLAVDMVIL